MEKEIATLNNEEIDSTAINELDSASKAAK